MCYFLVIYNKLKQTIARCDKSLYEDDARAHTHTVAAVAYDAMILSTRLRTDNVTFLIDSHRMIVSTVFHKYLTFAQHNQVNQMELHILYLYTNKINDYIILPRGHSKYFPLVAVIN